MRVVNPRSEEIDRARTAWHSLAVVHPKPFVSGLLVVGLLIGLAAAGLLLVVAYPPGLVVFGLVLIGTGVMRMRRERRRQSRA